MTDVKGFILLTKMADSAVIRINPAHLVAYWPTNTGSMVELSNASSFYAAEHPDQIDVLLGKIAEL